MSKAMALAIFAASLPAHGYANGQGPDLAQTTPANISEKVSDGVNAPPMAVTDYVDLDNAAHAFNVVANDLDANRDTLTVIAAYAQFGAVAYTSDGLVAYAANSSASRQPDKINYVLSDGRGGRAEGTVIITAR